jgi:hypothetical protein
MQSSIIHNLHAAKTIRTTNQKLDITSKQFSSRLLLTFSIVILTFLTIKGTSILDAVKDVVEDETELYMRSVHQQNS